MVATLGVMVCFRLLLGNVHWLFNRVYLGVYLRGCWLGLFVLLCVGGYFTPVSGFTGGCLVWLIFVCWLLILLFGWCDLLWSLCLVICFVFWWVFDFGLWGCCLLGWLYLIELFVCCGYCGFV